MSEFTRNIDELPHLSRKNIIVKHLKKNYKENVHYIIENPKPKDRQHGGQNKIEYYLTEKAFELLKNTYNLRNRYIVSVSNTVTQINPICMCIENQTIGFIENSFKDIIECKRQYCMDKYRVDLYFPLYKLVIECDENDHIDRDVFKEKIREDYILSLGNKIIRYNPNTTDFDLSNVLREIHKTIYLY
jgi:very-short-patch-repair endonuclease